MNLWETEEGWERIQGCFSFFHIFVKHTTRAFACVTHQELLSAWCSLGSDDYYDLCTGCLSISRLGQNATDERLGHVQN